MTILSRDYAIAAILSAVFAFAISTMVIGSILVWGVPYINNLQDENILEDVQSQFNAVIGGIDDLIGGESAGQKTLSLTGSKGSIVLDGQEVVRTVFIYSYSDFISFTAKGFERYEDFFILNELKGEKKLSKVEATWLSNDGQETTEDISSSIQEVADYSWLVSCDKSKKVFAGTVEINLYYRDPVGLDVLFGKIWVFDSNLFSYISSDESYMFSVDNNALIYTADASSNMVNSPNFILEEDDVIFEVVQTPVLSSYSSGSNGFNARIAMHSYSGRTFLEKNTDVYFLRLQFFGGKADFWLDYFDDLGFTRAGEPNNTLLYESSSEAVHFSLSNALVELSMS